MRIFISYNHSDKEFVSSLEKSLQEKSINYFLDEKNISFGDSLSGSIHDAFSTITHLIVVISPGSAKSHWVSFELGMALGRGIKVIPILVHPAMDLPTFIGDLKYFKTKEEFDLHFHKLSLNTLNIEVSVDLVHCQDLGLHHEQFKGQTGFRKFEDGDENKLQDNVPWEPAFTVNIKNNVGRTIELESPMIEFITPQNGIAKDSTVDAVGFMPMMPKSLVQGGEQEYKHFGEICRGSVLALVKENIKCISIKSTDGFIYKVESNAFSEQKKYAEKFFNHIL